MQFIHLLFAICFLLLGYWAPKYYTHIKRRRNKKLRKQRRNHLFGINPRANRFWQPVITESMLRLKWLISLNRPKIQEDIKEYCEIMGLDNSCHDINTLIIAETLEGSWSKIMKKVVQIYKSAQVQCHQFEESIVESAIRFKSVVKRAMNCSYKLIHGQLIGLIKFVQNTGGVKNGKESNKTKSLH